MLRPRERERALRARDRDVPPFRQRTARVGLKADVINVAEALELLDADDPDSPQGAR